MPYPIQRLSKHDFDSSTDCISWPVQVCSLIKWYEVFFAISITVAVGLVSLPYKDVGQRGQVLVPASFVSNQMLFHTLVIMNALTFTASATGMLLHGLHRQVDRPLFLFALTTSFVAFAIYVFVVLSSEIQNVRVCAAKRPVTAVFKDMTRSLSR